MAHVYVTVPYIWIILFIYQHTYIVICIKASLYSVRYIQYVGVSPMNSGSPGCWSPSEAPHTHTHAFRRYKRDFSSDSHAAWFWISHSRFYEKSPKRQQKKKREMPVFGFRKIFTSRRQRNSETFTL